MLPVPGLELVRIRGADRPPEVAALVSADPSVRYAEPNALWFPAEFPNDPEFPQLWGLHNTGQTGGSIDADIDAPEAWDIDANGSPIVVAVLDTGIWIDHPDLQASMWTNPEEIPGNGVDEDANGYVDDVHGWDFYNDDRTLFDEADLDDHGTHVAGTIAASINNGIDVSGVSSARIMALKFIGPGGGSTSDAVLALDYAIDNGARVANNSWGGGGSQALQEKIQEANQAGLLFVAAAGNGGSDGIGDDNDTAPFYPASYPTDNVVAVAATTDADDLATFSNFGATSVDLGAPGEGILSTVPRFAKAVLVGPDTGAGVGYRSALHSFGLEGVPSATDRQELLSAALSWMDVATGAPILVVDDDWGEGYETVYTAALSSLGYANVTTFTVPLTGACPTQDGPDAATMAAYRLVVWVTGYDFDCTFNGQDTANLEAYLEGGQGRNLLAFGQDIDYDLTDGGVLINTFMRDYLRTDYLADYDLNFRPSGVVGTPYASVPVMELDPDLPPILGDDPAGQFWTSALALRSGAVAGMRGAPTTWFDGTSMATPHVAAAAAMIMAKFPGLSHLAVKSRLMATGDPLDALDGLTVSGRRLNVASALGSGEPAPPSSLTATARAGGQIDVSWLASSGPDVAGYSVYRGSTSGFTPTPANRVASLVAGTTYSDPGSSTVHGATYYYVVRAQGTGGTESANSNEASAAADKVAPPAPSGLTIPAGYGWTDDHIADANASSVSVSGTKSADAVTVTLAFSQGSTQRVRILSGLGPGITFTDLQGLDSTAPPAFSDGSVTIAAVAEDEAGNVSPASAPLTAVRDTVPPTVTILSGPSGTVASSSAVFEFSADEAATFECRLDGDTFDPCFTPGSYSGLPEGPHTFLVRARDAAGNTGIEVARTWTVDTALDPTPPSAGMAVLEAYQRGPRFAVSWIGTDDGSGVERYDVEVRQAGPVGAWGPWEPWLTTSDSDATFEGRTGSTYCFRVRATDGAGNTSGPSGEACTAVPLDDPQLVHRGPWKQRKAAGSYLGTYSLSKTEGSRLILRDVEATQLALLVTRCRSCGRIEVRFGGALLGRYGLRGRAIERFTEIPIAAFDNPRRGKLELEVLTTGRPVCVEGVGIRRT